MKLKGTILETSCLTDAYKVSGAVMTADHIEIDWEEDWDKWHAVLNSADGGYTYDGIFGCPFPDKTSTMRACRYRSSPGKYLLWIEWIEGPTGREGCSIVHLETNSAK